MKPALAYAILALLAVPASSPAAESFARVGIDFVVYVLDFPIGLRNLGMGATGVADMQRSANGYFNPAGVAYADAARLSFGYQDHIGDISMTDARLAGARRWGDDASRLRLGGSIGYTEMDFPEVEVGTVFLPQGAGFLKVRDYYLTASLAGAWERGDEAVALGVSSKYVRLDSADGYVSAWAFDYGLVVARRFTRNGSTIRPRVGASLSNHDTGLEFDGVTASIANVTRVGFGIDVAGSPVRRRGRDVSTMTASFDVDYVDPSRGFSFWAFGWELGLLELIHLRAGYQWFEEDYPYHIVTLGAGIGWSIGPWTLGADYAHAAQPPSLGVDRDRDAFGATLAGRF